jgi:CHAD domain-containing protein
MSLNSRVGSGGGGSGGNDATAHHHHHNQHQQQQQQPANTKQLMRLLDSLKTLGDENAALLREVEEAEAARMEAKAAREQMKRFKTEYGQRFAALKAALEKFRKGYPENNNNNSNTTAPTRSSSHDNAPNPVTSRYVACCL